MPAPLAVELDVVAEVELPPSLDLGTWEALARFVLAAEGQHGSWSIAAVLVDDDRLRVLHRDFMGLDAPTDVMTFPSGDALVPVVGGGDGIGSGLGSGGTREPGSGRGGDVVISVDRAWDQAATYGHTPAEEVRFLFVHGLLHLAGWDDATAAKRARMLDRGTELLRAFDAR